MIDNIILINIVSGVQLELDMVTTPNYVLDSVSWGEIASDKQTYKFIKQVGRYVEEVLLETRDVEITGWVVASDAAEMERRKRMLNSFINPQQGLDVLYKNYTLSFLPDTTVKYSVGYEENNDVMCKFRIYGTAHNPLFSDVAENKIDIATIEPMFHFPLAMCREPEHPVIFGLRQPSLIININNSGDIASGLKIIFKANGTLYGPSLINAKTQEYFKINKTMTAGETVEIDTTIGQKTIKGIIGHKVENYFKYRDFGSTWLQLDVGDNLITYNAEQNLDALDVYVYFKNKYLEVQ